MHKKQSDAADDGGDDGNDGNEGIMQKETKQNLCRVSK